MSSGAPALPGSTALPRSFFERPVVELAAALIGQCLVKRDERGTSMLRIVETEAYGGRNTDPSAHSFRGPTPRCNVMFGPAGHAYVYATQGRCHCLNVVAEGGRDGRAVLIRAGELLTEPSADPNAEQESGREVMRARRLARLATGPTRARLLAGHDHELASGPGRLCLCLDVDRALDGIDLTDAAGPLFLISPAAASLPAGSRASRRGTLRGTVRWTSRIGLNPSSASHGWRWRCLDPSSRAVSKGPGKAPRLWRTPRPAVCPDIQTSSAAGRPDPCGRTVCGP